MVHSSVSLVLSNVIGHFPFEKARVKKDSELKKKKRNEEADQRDMKEKRRKIDAEKIHK